MPPETKQFAIIGSGITAICLGIAFLVAGVGLLGQILFGLGSATLLVFLVVEVSRAMFRR